MELYVPSDGEVTLEVQHAALEVQHVSHLAGVCAVMGGAWSHGGHMGSHIGGRERAVREAARAGWRALRMCERCASDAIHTM